MMKIMKTQSIARCGLLCGIYGAVLWVNTLSGLWLEAALPMLFGLPVLMIALLYERTLVFSSLGAMVVLTFLFSPFSTWIMAGTMLVCGMVFGLGMKSGRNLVTLALWCWPLMGLINLLTMTLLAGLFGFDAQAERLAFAPFSGLLSWPTWLVLLALLIGAVQTVGMAAGAVVVVSRLHKYINIQPVLAFGLWPGLAVVGPVVLMIWLAGFTGVVSYPIGLRDVFLVIALVCFAAYILRGTALLVRKLKPNPHFFQVLFIEVLGVIPGLQLIPAAMGWFDFCRQMGSTIQRKMRKP